MVSTSSVKQKKPYFAISKECRIARNILAQKQFMDIANEFAKNRIDFIPLKGIALINLVYTDIGERFMEDVDILVKDKDLAKIHTVMIELGYSPAPDEPLGWIPSEAGAPIDFHTDIWYLSKNEMNEMWEIPLSAEFDGIKCRVFPKEDMIIHAVAHSFIHHGQNNESWQKDVLAMFNRWKGELDISSLSCKLYKYNLTVPFNAAFDIIRETFSVGEISQLSDELNQKRCGKKEALLMKFVGMRHPLKGHILRFLFIRDITHKIRYMFKALFPSSYVMGRRYNRKSKPGILAAYLWRPVSFVMYTVQILQRFTR